jgi:4-amino-4-deoxy-L-arabinose transferase-like glycosyltransferase
MVELSKTQKYKRVLAKFMSFKDNAHYNIEKEFTPQELAAVMPDDISKWFKLRAYGSTDADEDARPLGCRSTSLLFWKKAISFFMPNTNMQWNELSHVGNPTRSQEVNKLIKTVRRKETARLGKPSEARRALYASEFEQAIEMMENSDDAEVACFLSAKEACNKIYEVYGQNLSVTQILNQMKRDKLDRGGHPALSTLSNAV